MSNFVLTPNAVAKLRRAIAPRSGNTGAAAASGRPIDPDKFPPPFTVRWSSSANDGAGAWLIWLPSEGESPLPDELVIYDGEEVTIDGVTAADNLPAGWYTIDDADGQSEEVYLVITVTDSTGAAEAELSETEGQATTGETVYNIKVAAMATDAETGARSVKQYVDSVVTFGGGGDAVAPDDVSTDFIPDPPAGQQPDGDEGKLQIKGFKSGAPTSQNNLAEYLQEVAQIPSSGIMIVARWVDSDGAHLFYIPIAALDLSDYAKTTDLPTVNDGTLTIKQGTTTLGTFTANQATGTTVTIPEPPTPTTVNDGTLTLNLGSLSKTFSANQATNETITVPAKTIAAGSNVAISVNGNTITISATGGGATSGFSGTRRTLALTRYDISTNQLQAKYFTETWSNGIMTASAIDSEWSVIEGGQAVVETV
jgi:hypothetical protein